MFGERRRPAWVFKAVVAATATATVSLISSGIYLSPPLLFPSQCAKVHVCSLRHGSCDQTEPSGSNAFRKGFEQKVLFILDLVIRQDFT